MPSKGIVKSTEDPMSESPARGKTFAAMARRFCFKDNEGENEQSLHTSISFAGVLKLQPNGKMAHDSWRPSTSDVAKLEGPSHYNENTCSNTGNVQVHPSLGRSTSSVFFTPAPSSPYYGQSTLLSEAPTASQYQTDRTNRADTVGPSLNLPGTDHHFSTKAIHSNSNDRHAELFGKLPDPIRLHEQLGEFDGQVIFIGHPNRDVSAHQWSSTSFQWENIGQYVHSRSKIEGTLASDRLKEYDTSRNTLIYFKRAAENREKVVVEGGRPKKVALGIVEPNDANVIRNITTCNMSKLPAEEIYGSVVSYPPFSEIGATASTPIDHTLRTEHLDDPFVAEKRPPGFDLPIRGLSRSDVADAKGSLDLKYEFPVRSSTSSLQLSRDSTTATPLGRNLQGLGVPYMLHYRSQACEGMVQPNLREVVFGEEALTGSTGSLSSDVSSTVPHQVPASITPEAFEAHSKSMDHVYKCREHTERPDAPTQERIKVPKVGVLQPTARSMFHPPGLTIANPLRSVPRLDPTASAEADNHQSYQSPKVHRKETTVMKVTATATLHFSDPDGIQQAQGYEIANGLSQQSPTVQSFKGPFFTASKPTAHDPTVSLAIHVSEEEKLLHWFQDGHRPARQREYAKSLASAAAAQGKRRGLGAIGDTASVPHYSPADNMTPFVRLYESLSEYIEEYRNGNGGSYFNRSWKAASPYLRDLGPDGNNSYFAGAATDASRFHQDANIGKGYQEARIRNVGGVSSRGNIMQLCASTEGVRGSSHAYGDMYVRKVGTRTNAR